jgi:O-antigen ligase
MESMSASDESAFGRIEAWYYGIQLFKHAPLMGVGMGMFTESYELTAHNSFILVFSELGFLGAFFFVGIFYFPLSGIAKTHYQRNSQQEIQPLLSGSYNAILGGMVGTMVSMFFLSRSYDLLPYMLVALPTSMSLQKTDMSSHASNGSYADYKKIFFITASGMLAIYILVKVLL